MIPDSVTSIGNTVFVWCSSLTSITIPDRVTSIGNLAFYWCESLESITISKSVTRIDLMVFAYCKSLTSITYTGTKAQWQAISKDSNWDDNTGNYTVYCTDGNIKK